MENKVFRFHKGQNVTHWGNTSAYGLNEIAAIPDPTGLRTGKPITSIPSPFARLDLVRAAFGFVASRATSNLAFLEGEGGITDYHQLVSDTLDIAQILFDADALKAKLRIKVWDRTRDLPRLTASQQKGTRLLGETLDLFLRQDAPTNNFDAMNRIFLVEYDYQMIGGTSPTTLFFTSANKLTGSTITFPDGHTAFGTPCPLHLRDEAFVKFFFAYFRKANFAGRMKELNDYLVQTEKQLQKSKPVLFEAIRNLNFDTFEASYAELRSDDNSPVEILGAYFHKKQQNKAGISAASAFVIASTKYQANLSPEGQMPLALFGAKKPLQYTDATTWNINEFVPPFVTEALEKRTLPGQYVVYPYLTVSDFLEPYLIKTVFPIDKKRFFDGNLTVESGSDKRGYLLPIQPFFFEFFDAQDLLTGRMSDGKPMFEFTQMDRGTVRATLRIPIQGKEYVSFERLYEPSSEHEISTPDLANNRGVLLENQFSITLFPFLKPANEAPKTDFLPNVYRVQLIEQDFDPRFVQNGYKLNFYHGKNRVETPDARTRTPRNLSDITSAATHYYAVNQGFDAIQVTTKTARGFVLPCWENRPSGSKKFNFSLDFGTTNSHIEYREDNQQPKAFHITKNEEIQIATLFDDTRTSRDFDGTGATLLREQVLREFIPHLIGGNADYAFPLRTVISENRGIRFDGKNLALADLCIGFIYNRLEDKDSEFRTYLKWSDTNEPGNKVRVQAFFEEALLLMRNKVLLNGGNLAETELTWFYPSSMTFNQFSIIKEIVETAYKRVIGGKSIRALTESVAPFYYYAHTASTDTGMSITAAKNPSVSIDIGGGTTDVVVFQKVRTDALTEAVRPVVTTSFRFASNALFGTGFATSASAETNGFVKKYLPYFLEQLKKNPVLATVAKLLEERRTSSAEEVNNFLFSVETNPDVVRYAPQSKLFSYNALLGQDPDLRLLFLYFHAALCYHVAKLCKGLGIAIPKDILFSGTASKVMEVVSLNDDLITRFTKEIFEKVYGESLPRDLTFSVLRNKKQPKEITAKGGLLLTEDDIHQLTEGQGLGLLPEKMKALNTVFSGLEATPVLNHEQLLDDDTQAALVAEVRAFHAFFIGLNDRYPFGEYFGISSEALQIFKNECDTGLLEPLMAGIAQRRGSGLIDESPFFYPIIATVLKMANRLQGLHQVAAV